MGATAHRLRLVFRLGFLTARIMQTTRAYKFFLVVALLAVGWGTETHARMRTVCTITVNSTDEKEMFRQRLPEDQYQFVELVERGRPDWLASACRQGVRCDLL